jgi:hypothetical protein
LVETLDSLRLGALTERLAHHELATAVPWHVMTMLIGTSLERDGRVLYDFRGYRDALARELDDRSRLDARAFEASLLAPVDPRLDTAREAIVKALAEQQRVLN